MKDDIIDYSCEDDVCEETPGSARQLRSSSRARPLSSSSDCFPSTVDSCTPNYTSLFEPLGSSRGCGPSFSQCPSSTNQNISPSHSNTSASSSSYQLPTPFPNSCLSTSQPYASSFEGTSLVLTSQNVSSSSQQSSTPGNHSASTSTHYQYTTYESYLSVMAALSDASSDDEELNQAILESLHTERFRDGLRTLGVLDKIQAHPDSFRPLLCWSPTTLSADVVDGLFTIRLSPGGSNRRRAEEVVVPFWRDYLTDAEDEEGTQKLALILAFATGANAVPPIGFTPQPSIEFLHQEDDSGTTAKLPIANTCINCLKLPLHTPYRDFQENMDFALGNTH